MQKKLFQMLFISVKIILDSGAIDIDFSVYHKRHTL